jgi:hypothetical protein
MKGTTMASKSKGRDIVGGRKIKSQEDKEQDRFKKRFKPDVNIIEKQIVENNPPRTDLNISASYFNSFHTLDKYSTLDWKHAYDIDLLTRHIESYIGDKERTRPFNILLQAVPGSGKSHFVKCLTEKIEDLNNRYVQFNMAMADDFDDLDESLKEVHSLTEHKDIPLLFLDEFDSNPAFIPFLLPILWDGAFRYKKMHQQLKKVVIILAGSGRAIDKMINLSGQMQTETIEEGSKLVDFLSRINGGIVRIPDIDLIEHGRNRKVDKICISISLLKQRFGNSLTHIPWKLLHFIGISHFRYSVRSISHLIDLIDKSAFDSINKLDLGNIQLAKNPFDITNEAKMRRSSLLYHLISNEGPYEIVKLWENIKCNKYVIIDNLIDD